MSDKFTEVVAPSGGIGEWGHVEPVDAVERLRAHFAQQAKQATGVLAEIESGRVRVYHQYGPYAATNRRLVSGSSEQGDTK